MWKQIVSLSNVTPSLPNDVQHVLDGGALLHRISWDNRETYDEIYARYTRYVKHKYNSAIIVFDGYENGPSTKDAAHAKRIKSCSSIPIRFTGDMKCSTKKTDFLANQANKQNFIKLLGDKLEQCGNTVIHAAADADVLLVSTTIKSANNRPTILIGDDTDLLVLLCSKKSETRYDIFFQPELKLTSKKAPRCWNIKLVQETFGDAVCSNLLFAHAILGCDTTSRVYGIGKPVALKKLMKDEFFRTQAEVFGTPRANPSDIMIAGEHALVCLYGGQPGDRLNTVRLQHFYKKVSSSKASVQPKILPPTLSASKYHSLRVYHQVQQWSGVDLPPQDWGWKLCNGKMVPIQTDLEPAPEYLLDVIRCSCKTDCLTQRCSCRKYGLECSPACRTCKGLLCSNISPPESDSDFEDILGDN